MGDNDVTIGKVKFLDFSCSEGIRRSPELLSDQSLRCSSCGEGPLFKGRDLYVAFYVRGGRLESELKNFLKAMQRLRAVECVSCLSIYCFGCISKSSEQGRCLTCGGELLQLFMRKREKSGRSYTREEYVEIARTLATLLRKTRRQGDEEDIDDHEDRGTSCRG